VKGARIKKRKTLIFKQQTPVHNGIHADPSHHLLKVLLARNFTRHSMAHTAIIQRSSVLIRL
jgi:hypothetical protein